MLKLCAPTILDRSSTDKIVEANFRPMLNSYSNYSLSDTVKCTIDEVVNTNDVIVINNNEEVTQVENSATRPVSNSSIEIVKIPCFTESQTDIQEQKQKKNNSCL